MKPRDEWGPADHLAEMIFIVAGLLGLGMIILLILASINNWH